MSHQHYPVVLVHGYYATPATNEPVKRFLRARHMRTYNVDLPGLNFQDMRVSARLLAQRVEAVKQKYQTDKVLMVGVSMGGLIGLQYIRHEGGAKQVQRFVAMGSPFHGSPIAGIGRVISGFTAAAAKQIHPRSTFLRSLHARNLPDCDIVSISAHMDPLAPPRYCHLEGAKNVIIKDVRVPFGHWELILNPKNLDTMYKELVQ